MDLDRLEKHIRTQVKSLYLAKHPEPGVVNEIEGFDAQMFRYKKMIERIRAHRTFKRNRQKWHHRIDAFHHQIANAKAALDQGARFLSFDIEFFKPNDEFPLSATTELGYTVLHGDDSFVVNFRPEERPDRIHFHGFEFQYGVTEIVPWQTMMNRLQEEARKADFYIGHELASDHKHLEEHGIVLPERRTFDTALWSRVIRNPQTEHELSCSLKLEETAKLVGVEAPYLHVAGNDSYYTMQTFLAAVKAFSK